MNEYVITPESDIELLYVNIQLDNKNQLTFQNIEAQNNFFDNIPTKYLIDNSTFQRNDYTIRVPLEYDDMVKYNYCRYKNNDKWYYAFIVDVTYNNSNMTTARLITDVWQTYLFDIELLPSFIEREHVSSDIVGENTQPEELELGDYICTEAKFLGDEYVYGNDDYAICLETSINPNTLTDISNSISGGIPYAYGQFLYKCNASGIDALQNAIKKIISTGGENRESAILNLYLVHPLAIVGTFENGQQVGGDKPKHTKVSVSEITSLNNYTPVNKKLLTYPYCYYELTNGGNGLAIYKPELFNNTNEETGKNSFVGNIYGIIMAGNSITFIPSNYGGAYPFGGESSYGNYVETLNMAKLPLLSWNTDPYIAWLVNNSLNQTYRELRQDVKTYSTLASDIGSIASNLFSPFGTIGGSIMATSNYSANKTEGMLIEFENARERYLHSLEPNSVRGGTDGAEVNLTTGGLNYLIRKMTIKSEYARIIDGYFYKYGYKINRTKSININSRKNFNYIKTGGLLVRGDIPQTYLNTIKSMFDSGITFWHNESTFLRYDINYKNNEIL